MLHRTLLGIALATLAALVGCGGGKRDQLVAKAASDFSCDQGAITTEALGMYFEKAAGCGKEGSYVFDGQGWVSPIDRAAFEMSCPKSQLTSTVIERKTVGVTGCGKKGVYVLVTSPSGPSWLLNSTDDAGSAKQGASPSDQPVAK